MLVPLLLLPAMLPLRPSVPRVHAGGGARCAPVVARFDDLSPTDDPYALLGVGRSASATEMRAAFKRKARECHPDVSTEAGADGKFRKLVAAYSVLSDDVRRADWIRSRSAASSRVYAPAEPEPDTIFAKAQARWGWLATLGFVLGQWATWWLFLYSMSHVAAPVQAMCGSVPGPC